MLCEAGSYFKGQDIVALRLGSLHNVMNGWVIKCVKNKPSLEDARSEWQVRDSEIDLVWRVGRSASHGRVFVAEPMCLN